MTSTLPLPAPALAAVAPARTFREVFDDLAPLVFRLLRRVGVGAAELDDACQEVFLVVHRRLPEFDGATATHKTWVFRIALRVASDHRRRATARREAPMDPLPEVAVPASQEGTLETKSRLALLDALLAKLDERAREVIILHDIEELPMSEVAAVVDCPLQTAYSRLHAARRDLDAALQRARARKETP